MLTIVVGNERCLLALARCLVAHGDTICGKGSTGFSGLSLPVCCRIARNIDEQYTFSKVTLTASSRLTLDAEEGVAGILDDDGSEFIDGPGWDLVLENTATAS